MFFRKKLYSLRVSGPGYGKSRRGSNAQTIPLGAHWFPPISTRQARDEILRHLGNRLIEDATYVVDLIQLGNDRPLRSWCWQYYMDCDDDGRPVHGFTTVN